MTVVRLAAMWACYSGYKSGSKKSDKEALPNDRKVRMSLHILFIWGHSIPSGLMLPAHVIIYGESHQRLLLGLLVFTRQSLGKTLDLLVAVAENPAGCMIGFASGSAWKEHATDMLG